MKQHFALPIFEAAKLRKSHVRVIVVVLYRGGTRVHALEDVLPLSSQFLMSSVSGYTPGGEGHQKPDVATLAAENHAVLTAMQQQRFKLKV